MTSREHTSAVLAAAAGLAASYFPADDGGGFCRTTTYEEVRYVIDGHVDCWSGWETLSGTERKRFARLLKHRANSMVEELMGELFDSLLRKGDIPGCAPVDGVEGTVVVDPGMSLPDFVDGMLARLDGLRARRLRSLPVAAAGPHRATTSVRGLGRRSERVPTTHYFIKPHHAPPAVPPPPLRDAPDLPELMVPFAELAEIAEEIDKHEVDRGRQAFRADRVRKFENEIRSAVSDVSAGLCLTAGRINELLAYTGFGKSVVLVEVFACWAVRNEVTAAFVLPTNADVVKAASRIESAVAHFREGAKIVPLVSPQSMIRVAETAGTNARRGGSPDLAWIWGKFGYGCALPSAESGGDGVDGWRPGREPCAKLRSPRPNRRRDETVACPWRITCGKFDRVREALSADVIVTSHANLITGRLQTPVDDGDGPSDRVTVEELVLRRCQVVVIDEVDQFQRGCIEQAGRGLVLDEGGRTDTLLRRFDADFGEAFGELQAEVDAYVRDALFGLRYLSELYVSHVTYDRIGAASSSHKRRKPGPGRNWIVPRRWDNWLAGALFGVEPEDVDDRRRALFRSLFHNEREPLPDEPEGFAEARRLLDLAVTGGLGGAAVLAARVALDGLFTHLPVAERGGAVNRVLRRALLEKIRGYLHALLANTGQLDAAGVGSAQEIADALGGYGRWQATPRGPLGRLVFAFTESYDDSGNQPVRLSTAAFGGDPHSYVVGLGDITALAHSGTRRIVLGMSATSYFPGAPHHHLHTEPRWWVPDVNSGAVRIRAVPVPDRHGVAVRVSGTSGSARTDATRRIAAGLWTDHLRDELDRLAVQDEERQRVLIATTSYSSGPDIARGLIEAGATPSHICVACRPTDTVSGDDVRGWQTLPADRLDEFPGSTAKILIAPLARVQRGVNMIGQDDRSALGSVWLLVRPIPLIDEPAELLAHVHAKAHATVKRLSGAPRDILDERRSTALEYFDEIVSKPPYFQSQPRDVRLSVVAEILVGGVQLVGRARRGGTSAVLHLVDGAFHDTSGGNDLATLIRELEAGWGADVLADLRAYYGTTLDAILDYAHGRNEN
ncbi:hypothetical protein [Actinocorallia sp. A-T 12471]|uniref:hypothetical protein n=1 Tax=Actinocorallia sp. A-T 12471 TaxID=3089813 RepID=UPI0029CE6B57|nr:hypothetical protein [Actinocorallia sp. A-T 12471]MDX6740420.1 hypothetical protein [Actinocorallia sp. A-T 12471]